MTTATAITAAALANCLGTDSRTVLDRAFAGDDAFSPAGALHEFPFPTMLGIMPGIDPPSSRKSHLWIDPRDATRGGVNGPALPGQRGRESPLSIDSDGDDHALDCIPTRLAMAALPSVRELRPAVRAAVDRWGARRVAYVFASSTGGLDETERALAPDPRLPLAGARYRYTDHGIDATSQAIARSFGVLGACLAISTACSSSFHALASARRLIDRGLADAVIVGSADSLCRTTVFGFHSLGLSAPTATRPFARDRAGITLGEGSAYVLVERDAPDTRRRALAWIAGIGAASDAFHHTSPHPEGLGGQLCMRQALDRAGLSPEAIDCVSAHGTGTKLNDAAEATAVRQVFGRRVPLTATKSLTGHTLGSAGMTSLVLAVESLRRQAIPATLRTAPLDETLGMEVVDRLTAAELRHVMVNAFGFGGSNVSVVLRRPDLREAGPS